MHTDLLHTRTNRWHRLPVRRIVALLNFPELNCTKVVPDVMDTTTQLSRKCLNLGGEFSGPWGFALFRRTFNGFASSSHHLCQGPRTTPFATIKAYCHKEGGEHRELKCLGQSCLLQDPISGVPRFDVAIYRKVETRDRAIPDFVVALSLAYKRAPCLFQQLLEPPCISSHPVVISCRPVGIAVGFVSTTPPAAEAFPAPQVPASSAQ